MPRLRMCPEFNINSPTIIDDEEFAVSPNFSKEAPVDLSTHPATAHFFNTALVPSDGSPTNSTRDHCSGGEGLSDARCSTVGRRDSRTELSQNLTEMPRVVDNQREKYNTDAVLRRLSRETEVRYAGCPLERPTEQRRRQFEMDLDRGFLVMSIVSSGIHIMLSFRNPRSVPEASTSQEGDLSMAEIRNNQLVLQSRMILNGVCVIWNGYVDLETLDGVGRVEFDAATAEREHIAAFGSRRTS